MSLSYDATDGYVVMFGGYTYYGPPYLYNDTWTFQNDTWNNISSTLPTAPTPRQMYSFAFDWLDGYDLLFGGCEEGWWQPIYGPCFPSNNTWSFSGGRWTNLTANLPTLPPPSGVTSMTYDGADSQMIQVGTSSAIGPTNYTWAYGIASAPSPRVAFYTNPAACGSLTFSGTVYTNGQSVITTKGGHSLDATPCAGDGLANVSLMGSAFYWSENNTLQIGGNAVVIADFGPTDLTTVSVAPSFATIPVGSQQGFTASPTCTNGPCPSGTAYAWSMNRALGTLNSTSGSEVMFTAGSASGTDYLFVNATLHGVTVQSTPVALTIVPLPPIRYALTFLVNSAACMPLLFNGTTQASGSTGSFVGGTYSAHAPACTGGWTFEDWEFSPGTEGTPVWYYTAWANISIDAAGTLSAQYAPPPLLVSLSSNSTSAIIGSPVSFTPAISGGVSPYTCLWSLNGTNTTTTGCAESSLVWSYPGTYTYRLWVTDHDSEVGESNGVTISVSDVPSSPPLVAFANASSATGTIGLSCKGGITTTLPFNDAFAGSARGGRSPYAFSWEFGDDNSTATGQNVSHSYLSAGEFPVSFEVTDAAGSHAWANLTVRITAPPAPCSAGQAPGFSLLGLGGAESLAILAGLAAGAVLAAIALLVRERKKEAPPSTTSVRPDSEQMVPGNVSEPEAPPALSSPSKVPDPPP